MCVLGEGRLLQFSSVWLLPALPAAQRDKKEKVFTEIWGQCSICTQLTGRTPRSATTRTMITFWTFELCSAHQIPPVQGFGSLHRPGRRAISHINTSTSNSNNFRGKWRSESWGWKCEPENAFICGLCPNHAPRLKQHYPSRKEVIVLDVQMGKVRERWDRWTPCHYVQSTIHRTLCIFCNT